jgi:hypothetical protein
VLEIKTSELLLLSVIPLYNLWMDNGITLNNNNSEVFISSTGFDGLCRYSGAEEGKNKRFIIQVIPYLIR